MKLVKAVLAASIGAIIASSAVQAKQLTIGFSQIGAESEWRTANTNDVKEAAKAHNVNLKFSDAQQKQENQIKAIRTFIAQKVDLIGLVPIVATGWDNILREAKRAKIPVLIVDRDLTVSDPSLYVAKSGTDSYAEGQKVYKWIDDYVKANNVKPRNGGDKLNIVILEGTVGASATTGRGNGFNDAMKADPDGAKKFNILASQTGDFTRQKGQEVMESFLKSNRNDIDILFAMNDDMALGAVQAIEAAGLKPSKDIIIVSVDGVKGIFQAMIDGKTNATVECNPLQGELFFQTAEKVLKGESVPKSVFVEEGVYTADKAAEVFPSRKY